MEHVRGQECYCDSCLEVHAREEERKREGSKIAGIVADYVNGCSNPDYFVQGMHCQHRTLQQSFTALCVAWIEHLAKCHDQGTGYYDLRNEASVKLAKRLTKSKAWESKYLPHF